MSDNLRFYVMESPSPMIPSAFSLARGGGFSVTDINSVWLIKCITEMFGQIGIGWHYEITVRRV